jgi:hypothetical protein
MKVIENKFTKKDFDKLSDQINDDFATRKRKRKDLETQWEDIDRQLSMTPDCGHKMNANGQPDNKKSWMPEMELPLQAQTLEILTADAARMQFPDSGPWFAAHALQTDEYLERVDFSSLIAGDENDVPTNITQDNIDKLAKGAITFWENQYGFGENIDSINAEAFKYGVGIGRARLVNKQTYSSTAKGLIKLKQKIPVLVPRSIKNTYLDDSKHHLMNEGVMIGESVIFEKTQRIEDLVLAARNGTSNPDDENGGWMTKNIAKLKPNKHNEITLLEYEGDVVLSRSSKDSVYSPNTIVTVASGEGTREIVRIRYSKYSVNSYIPFHYHSEHLDSAYATSPLMKGRPIQIAAVDALNKMIMAGALNVLPPIRWDKDDPELALSGGPNIFPGAQWGSATKIDVMQIGNPAALMQLYMGLLQQYANVTGVNAPRLGAQTVSHTTAFAKEAEMSRGTVRTVDYVRATLNGPLEKWLSMAYEMGRSELKETSVFIPEYGGFAKISKENLPETVVFEAHGSGGPAEEGAKKQQRLQALQFAMQVDAQAKQMGMDTGLDMSKIVNEILREGGWTDIDIFYGEPPAPGEQGLQSPGLITGEPSALA